MTRERTYRGHTITRTFPSGYWETYLWAEGRFVKADTLEGIKRWITASLESTPMGGM